MKSRYSIFFIGLFLLIQSCSVGAKDCTGLCTEDYRTVIVKIKNNQGEAVALDNFKVVDLRTGRDLTLQPDDQTFQLMREKGSYPVFSDKYAQEFKQQQLNLKFTGFIGGEEIVNEIYKVGADCCHVYHISGALELVL